MIRKTAVMVTEEHEKECHRCLLVALTQLKRKRKKHAEKCVSLGDRRRWFGDSTGATG